MGQHLSKASGEHGAIQKQPKMTKRRVKRRKQISAKCKTLFAKDLTEAIEKLKQQFPNLLNIHDVVAQPERLILVSQDKCHIKRYQHICLAGTHVLYASALHLNTLLYASRSVGGRRLEEVTNIDP